MNVLHAPIAGKQRLVQNTKQRNIEGILKKKKRLFKKRKVVSFDRKDRHEREIPKKRKNFAVRHSKNVVVGNEFASTLFMNISN